MVSLSPARWLPATLPVLQALLAAGPALAQDPGGAGLRLTPTLALEQTFAEYRARPSRENGLESVTRVSPGFRISGRSGATSGALNYTANLLSRRGLDESSGREVQNSLDGSIVGEFVRGRALIEGRASITSQALSVAGQPLGTGIQRNPNRAEVFTASVSPVLRGPIVPGVDYEVRLTATRTDSRTTNDSFGAAVAAAADRADSRSAEGVVSLSSTPGVGTLGWGLRASRQEVRFREVARPAETERVVASLSYAPDVDWRFSVNAGRERTDVGLLEARERETAGAGVQWTPSPRTSVVLQGEDRYFGRAYRGTLQYRTPRTIWSYAAVRDVTNGSDAFGLGQPQSLYQLLFGQFASIESDPVRREQLVLDFLARLGRDPNERIAGGELSGATQLQQRHDASVAWQGRRLSLTLQAFRVSSRQIDDGGPVAAAAEAAQRGYSSAASYRLSPTLTVTFGGGRTISSSVQAREGTDLKTAYLALSATLGAQVVGALQSRYTVFNSVTDPYRETILAGSISLRF